MPLGPFFFNQGLSVLRAGENLILLPKSLLQFSHLSNVACNSIWGQDQVSTLSSRAHVLNVWGPGFYHQHQHQHQNQHHNNRKPLFPWLTSFWNCLKPIPGESFFSLHFIVLPQPLPGLPLTSDYRNYKEGKERKWEGIKKRWVGDNRDRGKGPWAHLWCISVEYGYI